MRDAVPAFMTGIFPFTGSGYTHSVAIGDALVYRVPRDRRSQLIYFRAGNSSDALVVVTLLRDGKPMRLFPIGAKAAMHIPLAVVEDLEPETVLSAVMGAPEGCSGTIVLDVGLMEI